MSQTLPMQEYPYLIVRDRVESTNDDVKAMILSGFPHGAAVFAHMQTKGRGRRAHAWASPRGGLYLSVLLRLGGKIMGTPALAPLAALAVTDVLDELGTPRETLPDGTVLPGALMVKWPNDLVCRGSKLGGILVETWSDSAGLSAACGIGLNVWPLQDRSALEPRQSRQSGRATSEPSPLNPISLEELGLVAPQCGDDAIQYLAEKIREALLARFDTWAAAWDQEEATGPLEPLLEDYHARLWHRGALMAAVGPDGTVLGSGELIGVDSWGRALLAGPQAPRALANAEASLRPLER